MADILIIILVCVCLILLGAINSKPIGYIVIGLAVLALIMGLVVPSLR